jgi:long-subunit fatty acid transport protein
VQLPFRTSVGLAYSPRVGRSDLVLSAQWDYADWQQIDYDGPIRTDDRRYAYRSTHDLRFGAEYRFALAPLTLRAGYIRQPVAFSLVGTDVFRGEARRARFDPDRAYFTFGAGFELDPTFRLDAAFATGRFTRSARSDRRIVTEEEFRERRLVLGATFEL